MDAVADTASLRTAKRQECTLNLDLAPLTVDRRRRPHPADPLQPPVQRLQVHRRRRKDLAGRGAHPASAQATSRARRRSGPTGAPGCGMGLGDRRGHRDQARRTCPSCSRNSARWTAPPAGGRRAPDWGSPSARSSWRCMAGPSARTRSTGRERPSGSCCRPTARSGGRTAAGARLSILQPMRRSRFRSGDLHLRPRSKAFPPAGSLPVSRHQPAQPGRLGVPLGPRRARPVPIPRRAGRRMSEPFGSLQPGPHRIRFRRSSHPAAASPASSRSPAQIRRVFGGFSPPAPTAAQYPNPELRPPSDPSDRRAPRGATLITNRRTT